MRDELRQDTTRITVDAVPDDSHRVAFHDWERLDEELLVTLRAGRDGGCRSSSGYGIRGVPDVERGQRHSVEPTLWSSPAGSSSLSKSSSRSRSKSRRYRSECGPLCWCSRYTRQERRPTRQASTREPNGSSRCPLPFDCSFRGLYPLRARGSPRGCRHRLRFWALSRHALDVVQRSWTSLSANTGVRTRRAAHAPAARQFAEPCADGWR